MRLIDACELKEIIDSNENLLDWQKEEMKICVDACETAYDVDDVVEEIRKKQRDAMYVKANMDVNKDFYKGLECGYEIAIDVVRNGGVK